jgi:aryl-alcohol dehydrogenase-like predicted oxidoreductase
MDYRPLGLSPLQVSAIGLGTMTFGEQNTLADACAQLDYALDAGINFIDTAELYPVPPQAQTQGRTETYIGQWLAQRPHVRSQIVLATKIAGPGPWVSYIRGGHTRFDRPTLEAAVNASLKRLQTDWIDLYQLHWPQRATNFFGRLGYQASDQDDGVSLAETLQALHEIVATGKIRYIGLSNETPWGLMHALALAEQHGWPRVVSIQNPYNLLNRSFEIGLAEIALREHCGLLAYSPLGFGILSGKYQHGARPEGARLTQYTHFNRYSNPQALQATTEYIAIAHEYGLHPVQLALAWVTSRPFVTSNLIGATTLAQLRDNIATIDLTLSDELIADLEAIHQRQPNPAP